MVVLVVVVVVVVVTIHNYTQNKWILIYPVPFGNTQLEVNIIIIVGLLENLNALTMH